MQCHCYIMEISKVGKAPFPSAKRQILNEETYTHTKQQSETKHPRQPFLGRYQNPIVRKN